MTEQEQELINLYRKLNRAGQADLWHYALHLSHLLRYQQREPAAGSDREGNKVIPLPRKGTDGQAPDALQILIQISDALMPDTLPANPEETEERMIDAIRAAGIADRITAADLDALTVKNYHTIRRAAERLAGPLLPKQ